MKGKAWKSLSNSKKQTHPMNMSCPCLPCQIDKAESQIKERKSLIKELITWFGQTDRQSLSHKPGVSGWKQDNGWGFEGVSS